MGQVSHQRNIPLGCSQQLSVLVAALTPNRVLLFTFYKLDLVDEHFEGFVDSVAPDASGRTEEGFKQE